MKTKIQNNNWNHSPTRDKRINKQNQKYTYIEGISSCPAYRAMFVTAHQPYTHSFPEDWLRVGCAAAAAGIFYVVLGRMVISAKKQCGTITGRTSPVAVENKWNEWKTGSETTFHHEWLMVPAGNCCAKKVGALVAGRDGWETYNCKCSDWRYIQ